MTYRECYKHGLELLEKAGLEEAALDARLLLEYVCGTNRNDLLVHGEQPVAENDLIRYQELLNKRAKRIPLQHLTGVQEFMGLTFQVNEHVLIPRQDTEILVEEVLRELHDGMRVLDMCTGSGCILLSLLHYSNGCQGVGVDISEEALKVATENASRLLGKEVMKTTEKAAIVNHERDAVNILEEGFQDNTEVCFLQSNLFDKVTGKYEIIVSNPPYIQSAVINTLMPEVRDYEPRLALDGTEDGLFFYRKIVQDSCKHLVSGGMLYFEIGYDQAESVSLLMQEAGFTEINVVKDYAGLDRVVYGTYIMNG